MGCPLLGSVEVRGSEYRHPVAGSSGGPDGLQEGRLPLGLFAALALVEPPPPARGIAELGQMTDAAWRIESRFGGEPEAAPRGRELPPDVACSRRCYRPAWWPTSRAHPLHLHRPYRRPWRLRRRWERWLSRLLPDRARPQVDVDHAHDAAEQKLRMRRRVEKTVEIGRFIQHLDIAATGRPPMRSPRAFFVRRTGREMHRVERGACFGQFLAISTRRRGLLLPPGLRSRTGRAW